VCVFFSPKFFGSIDCFLLCLYQAGSDDAPSSAFNESIAFVKKHFAAQKKLFDVTACYNTSDAEGCMGGGRSSGGQDNVPVQGFVARSFGPYGMEPLGPSGEQTPTNHRGWYNSSSYPGTIWKGDTSSDEVSGHMFTLAAMVALVPPLPSLEEAAADSDSPPLSSHLRGIGNDVLATEETTTTTTTTTTSPTLTALSVELQEERRQAIALIVAFLDSVLANNFTMIGKDFFFFRFPQKLLFSGPSPLYLRTTPHLIASSSVGYHCTAVDSDPALGTPTVWGRWDPETLNENRSSTSHCYHVLFGTALWLLRVVVLGEGVSVVARVIGCFLCQSLLD
jgi:hypothetical protein